MIRIKFLTFIRYPLAIWVLIYHLIDSTFLVWPQLPNMSKAVINTGKLAPSVFFILSGFVITQSLINKPNIKKFYFRRFAYILPIFIFTSTVMAVKFEVDRNYYFLNMIGLTPFLFSSKWFVLNGPAWSLIIEMWFYLLIPFVLQKVLKIKKPKLIILVVIMLQLFLPLLLNTEIDDKVVYNFIYHNPCYHASNFLLGVMLYSNFIKQKQLKNGAILSLKIFSYGLFIGGLTLTYVIHSEVYKYGTFVIPGAVALIFIYTTEQKYKVNSDKWKNFSRVGESAFAIYITQWLWIGIAREKINGVADLSDFVIILIIIIFCVTLTGLIFDKYVLRLILNYSQFNRYSKGFALFFTCVSLSVLFSASSKSTPYLTPESVKSLANLNLLETKLLKQSDGSIIAQARVENSTNFEVLINSCTFFGEKNSPKVERERFVNFKLNVNGVLPSGETSWVESKIDQENDIWKELYAVYESGTSNLKMVCN